MTHPNPRDPVPPLEPVEAQFVESRSGPPANPYQPPPAAAQPAPPPQTSSLDEYHKVADIVGGANLRWRDNLYQAVAIGVAVVLGAAAGAVVGSVAGGSPETALGGGLLGAFSGLVLGFFGSGIFLMIYRMFRH